MEIPGIGEELAKKIDEYLRTGSMHAFERMKGEVPQGVLDLLAVSGSLAATALLREEPLPAKHPFWHHSGITITPHVSAVTRVADSAAQVVAKLRALEGGESVGGIVDRARGY